MFVEAFAARTVHSDDVALARRLLSHESVEIVVAGLLRDHLGVRPGATTTATDGRRARLPGRGSKEAPVPSTSTDPKPTTSQKPSSERNLDPTTELLPVGTDSTANDYQFQRKRRKKHQNSSTLELAAGERRDDCSEEFDFGFTVSELPAREISKACLPGAEGNASPEPAQPGDELSGSPIDLNGKSEVPVEIFVNIGRRDGACSEDVLAKLVAHSIPSSAILHVSVRHHHSFVGVRRGSFQAALSALDGATLAGRVARAEPARTNRN
jgi:hypothetical protein